MRFLMRFLPIETTFVLGHPLNTWFAHAGPLSQGVLSGEKQKNGRHYDFAEVISWFAERYGGSIPGERVDCVKMALLWRSAPL